MGWRTRCAGPFGSNHCTRASQCDAGSEWDSLLLFSFGFGGISPERITCTPPEWQVRMVFPDLVKILSNLSGLFRPLSPLVIGRRLMFGSPCSRHVLVKRGGNHLTFEFVLVKFTSIQYGNGTVNFIFHELGSVELLPKVMPCNL